MVGHRHQHVLILGAAEEPRPQRNLRRQVKRVTGYRADGLPQPGCRPTGSIDNLPTEVGPLDRKHQLLRCSLRSGKQRAQTLMAGYHVNQRDTERVGIQPAAQPQGHRQVVHGRRPV